MAVDVDVGKLKGGKGDEEEWDEIARIERSLEAVRQRGDARPVFCPHPLPSFPPSLSLSFSPLRLCPPLPPFPPYPVSDFPPSASLLQTPYSRATDLGGMGNGDVGGKSIYFSPP